jgi:hypothetical protein
MNSRLTLATRMIGSSRLRSRLEEIQIMYLPFLRLAREFTTTSIVAIFEPIMLNWVQ